MIVQVSQSMCSIWCLWTVVMEWKPSVGLDHPVTRGIYVSAEMSRHLGHPGLQNFEKKNEQ